MKKNAPLYDVRDITDLKDMLAQSVSLYGDKDIFLIKETRGGPYVNITYKRFNDDIDAFGTALIDLGIEEARVAIIGESRYEWYITYMATVNGTAIVVPLDKELPPQEIANLIQRAHCNIVVFSESKAKDIDSIKNLIPGIKYYIGMDLTEDNGNELSFSGLLKKGNELIKNGDRSFLDVVIDPEIMRIILFTSGTTSDSKAVMLSHTNIASNLMGMCKMLYIGPGDIFLSVLPLHHTYECTCGFLCQLYRGSTIAQCEGLRYIVKNMQESKVTTMNVVPLMIESFYRKIFSKENSPKLKKAIAISNTLRKVGIDLRRILFKRVHEAFGGHLKMLISGGAPVDPKMLKDMQDIGIQAVQGYGLTECSPIIALNRDVFYKNASAGMVMPGVDIKIIDVDENGNGEIIAKGKNVMLGYYENEEATKASIIDGYFHTGDIGYIDKDNFVFITGRKKNVIITKNGKNIFPEEIETLLIREPHIKEALVYGKNEDDGDTSVSAEIFPDFEAVKDTLGENHTNEMMNKLIGDEVKKVNSMLVSYKHIKNFHLRDTEFEKTTSKKIKRSAFIPVNQQK
ncbi:MAG: AMP-dependent synthetase/ligase [Saccharofermentanales bacterium]